jgi:hypothetical protein
MDYFRNLLNTYPFQKEQIEWTLKNVNYNSILLAFLYKGGFCGSFSFSFQNKFVEMVKNKDIKINKKLQDYNIYFPELDKLDSVNKKKAYRIVKQEINTFRLIIKNPTLTFLKAWDLSLYQLEKDVKERILFRPYNRNTLFKFNGVTYLYDTVKLAKDLKDGKRFKDSEHLKNLFSLEIELV